MNVSRVKPMFATHKKIGVQIHDLKCSMRCKNAPYRLNRRAFQLHKIDISYIVYNLRSLIVNNACDASN